MRSQAQWRKMFALEEQGYLPKGTARRWGEHTNQPYSELPKRIGRRKRKAARRRKGGG